MRRGYVVVIIARRPRGAGARVGLGPWADAAATSGRRGRGRPGGRRRHRRAAAWPSGEESVRLIGIDTPETVKPDTPVQCFGPEASAHLHELLPDGTRVRVARDAEARDHFGRLLLYVWRADDDRFVNLDLVTGGFARPLSIAPNTAHAAEFAAAADEARRAGRGLWGACPGG